MRWMCEEGNCLVNAYVVCMFERRGLVLYYNLESDSMVS